MVKGVTCDDCGETIQPVATSVRRRGPTSGKQYSSGKSAETAVHVNLACDCRVYSSKATEELGAIDFQGHLPDAWGDDGKELDGSEHSKVD